MDQMYNHIQPSDGSESDSDNKVHLITFPKEKKEIIIPETLSQRIAKVLVQEEEARANKYQTSACKLYFKKSEYYLEDDNFLNVYKASEKRGSYFLGKGQFAKCFKLVLNRKDPDTGEIDDDTKVDIPENNYFYKDFNDVQNSASVEIRVCCKKVNFNQKKKKNQHHMTEKEKIEEDRKFFLKKQDHENEFIRELQNLLTITSKKQKHAKDGGIMRQAKHVMACIGIYFKNDNYLLITEFFNKGSLEKWLKKESKKTVRNDMKLTWKKMIDFTRQVIMGLKFLEQCCIVHRDIAARNICIHEPVNEDRQVLKIIDFGLARIVDPDSETGSAYFQDQKKINIRQLPIPITPVEIITNSYGFERDTPFEKADRGAFTYKSDIWALGVLMYEMSIYCRYNKSPKGFPIPFAKEVFENYYVPNVAKKSSSEELTDTELTNFQMNYPKYFCEFLAPNYVKYLKNLKSDEVFKSSKAHAYTNKKNRIVLRSDMPKNLRKLIKSTWKILDERPDADQLYKELFDICEKSGKSLEDKIEIEEPLSSFSCSTL